MRLLPQYADALSPSAAPLSGDDEAVMGLQASLRSSAALRAILECARGRCDNKGIPTTRLGLIEKMCTRYEEHHKAVRDHCLDYYNTRPELRSTIDISKRTDNLVKQGKELYQELREVILTF